jgi:hypothetical protein
MTSFEAEDYTEAVEFAKAYCRRFCYLNAKLLVECYDSIIMQVQEVSYEG